jgi:hypothetical protein
LRLREDVRSYLGHRRAAEIIADKPLMQALTFTLSALAALGRLDEDPLEDLIRPMLPLDVRAVLERIGALRGRPQSGNLAMGLAVVLIHARQFLGVDTTAELDTWVERHVTHQYEIFEFLRVDNPKLPAAKQAVLTLADSAGHFAPYPGGNSCYDYDAVFVMTAGDGRVGADICSVLQRTAGTILQEQGDDGGFCESKCVRPRTVANAQRFGHHLSSAWNRPSLFAERLRYAVTLQRPKHDEIRNHWSPDARRWDESNLWDTYFRMLALARTDVALNGDRALSWGFLPYPGLGYHPPSVAAIA